MSASTFNSAAGQVLSESGWLDTHFEACRPEYESMLHAAGLRQGWRVLDAGCGSGSFLRLIEDIVGPDGEAVGVDIERGNLEASARRGCESLALAGASDLPFATAAFDAVWCANLLQYFDDASAAAVLTELRRVVRPGGLVAIKDVDMTGLRFGPAPPFIALHLAEACIQGEDVRPESQGSLRGRALRRTLEASGLSDVWQRTFPIERWAPLEAATRRLWSDWLPYLAGLALDRVHDRNDLTLWSTIATPEAASRYVDRPDFYCCELQVLAVGTVPGSGDA
jgi:SAM-dependent methyltransferase